jgi:16S rRNA (guanine1516-N2)-methyltransferase
LRVDFLTSKFLRRIKQLSPNGELLARAVGLKTKSIKRVIDATAGFGHDGVLLALLGCEVTLIERSSRIATLLQEGLQRAQSNERFAHLSLRLLVTDAIDYLQALMPDEFPDVIYLDPMYPPRNKTALVGKEMRYLRAIVGEDNDAPKLFTRALTRARHRVVVKRPHHAPFITQQSPDWQLRGKAVRFDVYRPILRSTAICCGIEST